jgi:ribonucleoside-diphosphate reductase alpha chain
MSNLPSVYQNIIAKSRYARYLDDKQRRGSWKETVIRLCTYLNEKVSNYPSIDQDSINSMDDIFYAVLNLEIMPSMRLMMSAGEACDRDNVAAYNCSYSEMNGSGEVLKVLTDEMIEAGIEDAVSINISKPICFDEIMYILLCGTGVGFSCERQVVASLPVVGHKLGRNIYQRNNKNFPGVPKDELSTYNRRQNKIYVADSKYGWASALRILITELYNGNFKVTWDLSEIRPAGAPLKTFGGRASGPGPLNELFTYCINLFSNCNNRKLSSIEVHGLVCKIAEVVVVGGVRRSALISLSNLSDDRMRHAKSGQWWESNPEYALANNSIAYTEKPDIDTFMREMTALIESKSGERGIYNKVAASKQASRWGRRDANRNYGTNPCSEIILRDKQFCNLSEVVVRAGDEYHDLARKVKLATILGTIQATLTDFKYLSSEWKENTEEERLLGVSLTGIMDNKFTNGSKGAMMELLCTLREVARDTNAEWSNILGIPESAAITCVKPSGTVSQLVDSASGIHARHAPYYVRRIRMDKKDPMYTFLKDKGLQVEDDVRVPDTTAVFSFPMKAPDGAICRNDRGAIEQLELWLLYQRYWCEHKPSITISVKDEEWPDVIAWVWKYFDELSGVSFLPYDGGSYQQAPYEDLTEEEYNVLQSKMPTNIDLDSMIEIRDNTEGTQTLACVAGSCEI